MVAMGLEALHSRAAKVSLRGSVQGMEPRVWRRDTSRLAAKVYLRGLLLSGTTSCDLPALLLLTYLLTFGPFLRTLEWMYRP